MNDPNTTQYWRRQCLETLNKKSVIEKQLQWEQDLVQRQSLSQQLATQDMILEMQKEEYEQAKVIKAQVRQQETR